MLLTYTVEIQKGYQKDLNKIANTIQKIYDSKRGLTVLYNNKLKFKRVPLDKSANFHIKITSNEDIKRICGFDLLSCADMITNIIYLNYDRWWYGSPTFFDGLKTKDKKKQMELYRIYLVNHETGHQLGFDHPPKSYQVKSNEPCSFMAQQTINLHGGLSNPYPMITDKKYNKYKRF